MEPKPMAAGNLGGREDAIRANRCVSCRQSVPVEWAQEDPEYPQSGLCQKCQALVFGCTCDNPCCEVDVGVGLINCGSQHCPEHGIPYDCRACPPDCNTCAKDQTVCECYTHA